mgnify:CR=1 FL=1
MRVLSLTTDFTTWATRTSGTTQPLLSVAENASTIVAVGLDGAVVKSSDGATWTAHSVGLTGTAGGLTGVAAKTGGGFVAVGALGLVADSSDGPPWTARASLTSGDLYGVAVGSTTTVAVGGSGLIFSQD